MAFAYFILGQYDRGESVRKSPCELAADVHSLPALIANEVRQLGGLRMLASELYSS